MAMRSLRSSGLTFSMIQAWTLGFNPARYVSLHMALSLHCRELMRSLHFAIYLATDLSCFSSLSCALQVLFSSGLPNVVRNSSLNVSQVVHCAPSTGAAVPPAAAVATAWACVRYSLFSDPAQFDAIPIIKDRASQIWLCPSGKLRATWASPR